MLICPRLRLQPGVFRGPDNVVVLLVTVSQRDVTALSDPVSFIASASFVVNILICHSCFDYCEFQILEIVLCMFSRRNI